MSHLEGSRLDAMDRLLNPEKYVPAYTTLPWWQRLVRVFGLV